jgi:AcrR family transcriptional regulator
MRRKRIGTSVPSDISQAAAADPSIDQRGRIMDVAAHLFRTKGYSGTSTREISSLIGIQKASLYHHIDSKEALLYELCVDATQRILDRATVIAAENQEPIIKLRALMRQHAITMLDSQDRHATMLIELLHGSLTGERRAAVDSLRDKYQSVLYSAIRECQQVGDVRTDWNARDLTLAALSLLNWTVFWFDDQGRLTKSQVADLLTSTFLDGVKDQH